MPRRGELRFKGPPSLYPSGYIVQPNDVQSPFFACDLGRLQNAAARIADALEVRSIGIVKRFVRS
jgi:hypothetical protein